MTTRRISAGSRISLTSPWFLVALATLLANDLLLKGWGPGWITGKLSDFAWLIVAPVALAALLGARGGAARGTIVGAFSLLFIATELSQPAADTVCNAAHAIGIPCRLWADPTDLIALSVLPITWHLMAQPSGVAQRGPLAARFALAVAVFASIATTGPGPRAAPQWTTGAFVVNETTGGVDVRVRWTDAAIDCDGLSDADLSVAVSGAIFRDAITYRLLPNETVALEQPTDGTGTPVATGACQLVLISTDGADDTIVLVPGDTVLVLADQVPGALDVPERAVRVADLEDGRALAVGSELHFGLRDDRARPSTCTATGETFAVSSSMTPGVPETIAEISVGSDGCTAVVTDAGHRSFLCVPERLVRFEVGEMLRYLRPASPSAGTTVERFEGTSGSLFVVQAHEVASSSVGAFRVSIAGAEDCGGVRDACGAFARPLRVAAPTLDAAGFAERDGAILSVGRAERVDIAPTGCDAAHSRLGTLLFYAAFVASE